MTLRSNQVAGLAAAIAEIRPLPAPADALIHQHFRRHAEIGRADRAFITEGVFAYLRRRRSIETLAATTQPEKLALATLVRVQGHSVRELEGVVRAADARWLREFKARTDETLDAATLAELPDWLWQRLGAAYGDDARAALARALLAGATLDLRVNPLRVTREAVRVALAADGIVAVPTPWSPLGLRVQGRPSLARHPLLQDGSIEIQDEGSQLVGLLVAPKRNEMVVDFCAGAGGKTLLLGALMRSQGRLYAFDTVDWRLARLKPRLARSGLSNVHPQLIAHERDPRVRRLAGKIDRVLVDAPCTGFGTLRRNPGPQVAPAGDGRRRARRQAARDPRRGSDAAEARRSPGLCDLQHPARREPGRRRRLPRHPSGVRARGRGGGAEARRLPARHRAAPAVAAAPCTAATASSARSSSTRSETGPRRPPRRCRRGDRARLHRADRRRRRTRPPRCRAREPSSSPSPPATRSTRASSP